MAMLERLTSLVRRTLFQWKGAPLEGAEAVMHGLAVGA